jgi:hypothetical protein
VANKPKQAEPAEAGTPCILRTDIAVCLECLIAFKAKTAPLTCTCGLPLAIYTATSIKGKMTYKRKDQNAED